MKKLTLIVSALALLIGFSQCKKEEITPNSNNEGVFITLTAGYGQQDAKTDFNPTDGPSSSFCWSDTTEYIYVGGSKSEGCIGKLTGTGDGESSQITFSGTITPADGETELHFFYLGNGSHEGATTLDFSNQDGTKDNVTDYHIAIGSQTYSSGQTDFSATLNMAMAIAFFDLSGFNNDSKAAETVYLSGDDLYSTASINYSAGTITGNAKGSIKVGTANSGMYVALLPTTTPEVDASTTLQFNSNSKTGSFTFPKGIKQGKYYSNGGSALTVSTSAGNGIPGTFSVSATKKVFFSPGNLQYQASTGTWRFAENQYDYVGNSSNGVGNVYETIGGIATKCDNTQIADNYEGWIDLFGWGTSGCNHGATNYQPYNTDKDATYYYAYGDKANNLDSGNGKADWGIQNSSSIINSYEYHTWRTLTSAEWLYLFNTSSDRCKNGVYFCKCRIQIETSTYVNGIIILPDNWDNTYFAFPSDWYNKPAIGFDKVTVSLDNWRDCIQCNGGIFIPAAGKRSGTSYSDSGYMDYWSSTHYNDNYIYTLRATGYGGNMGDNSYSNYRYDGCAVRLVYDVD